MVAFGWVACYTRMAPHLHNLMAITSRVRATLGVCLTVATVTLHGCAGRSTVAHFDMVQLDGPAPAIRWMAPELDADRSSLGNWRVSVGPPVVVSPATRPTEPSDRLVVVNWNMHVGGGDIAGLLADVRRRHGGAPVVFLLQEAYREGPEVPVRLEAHASFASMIRSLRPDGSREEIESVAAAARPARLLRALDAQRRAGSVSRRSRQRHPLDAAADRPDGDRAAVRAAAPRGRRGNRRRRHQRPGRRGRFASCRRISTTWSARGACGSPAASSAAPARRAGWSRRCRATIRSCSAPISTRGSAFTTAPTAPPQRRSRQRRVTDRRATFHGMLRLDHLFFRLDEGWRAQFARADNTFGSDHYPLVGEIRFD